MKAAIQLCLGNSGKYLPELLGFNLGYEELPLHLLTTIDDLKELGIDSTYFQIHVSIGDNFPLF